MLAKTAGSASACRLANLERLEPRSSRAAVFCRSLLLVVLVVRVGMLEAELAAFLGRHFTAMSEPKHRLDGPVQTRVAFPAGAINGRRKCTSIDFFLLH